MNSSCGEPISVRFIDLHLDCVEFALNIFGYIIPFLSLFVTIMNVLIIIVFVKPHMRSQTTFILTLIAFVDILHIAFPAIVFAYHYLRGNYKAYLTRGQLKWTYIFGEICVDMLNMFSLWLTVLLAFIRCRSINSPFVARQVHSLRKIMTYIIAILVLVGFVHIPSFFIFEFKSVQTADPVTNLTKITGALIETEGLFLQSCSGRKIHIFLETITDSIIPCAILVCCNIKILIKLRSAKRIRCLLRRRDTVRITSGEKDAQGNKKVDTVLSNINHESTNDGLETDEKIHNNDRNKLNISKPRLEDNKSRTLPCSGKINHASTNAGLGTEEKIHDSDGNKPNITNPRLKDNKYKTLPFCGIDKSGNMKFSVFKCVKLHNFCTFRTDKSRVHILSDRSLDKLDRENERTSRLILLFLTIIILHELPLAVLNTYTLANYTDKPLPLSHGCLSIIILLWQFMTYPAIFLIYACMCKAFRKELWNVLTCHCKREKYKQSTGRREVGIRRTI